MSIALEQASANLFSNGLRNMRYRFFHLGLAEVERNTQNKLKNKLNNKLKNNRMRAK